jgi:hypothetical protein
MMKDLLAKIRAFLIGSVILAVSAGVAVVAAGFGFYAVLIQYRLTVPQSAGATAVVFAVVALTCLLLLRGLFSGGGGRDNRSRSGPARNPEAMQMGMEAGAAVIGLLTDLLASRQRDPRDKKRPRRSR